MRKVWYISEGTCSFLGLPISSSLPTDIYLECNGWWVRLYECRLLVPVFLCSTPTINVFQYHVGVIVDAAQTFDTRCKCSKKVVCLFSVDSVSYNVICLF